MNEPHPNSMDRRVFLQAGMAATAATTGLVAGIAAAQEPRSGNQTPILPKRKLGKTGVEVTLLNHGTVGEPAGLSRLLRTSYLAGVRYYDTAEGYKNSEKVIGEWLTAVPEVRKTIFLATKSHVGTPSDMLKKLDQRLAALKTDFIDLLFFHGLKSSETDWPKSKEAQGGSGGPQEDRQGQVRRLLDARPDDRSANPERRRGRFHRRDHAQVYAVA